jgi:hypothetical protein
MICAQLNTFGLFCACFLCFTLMNKFLLLCNLYRYFEVIIDRFTSPPIIPDPDTVWRVLVFWAIYPIHAFYCLSTSDRVRWLNLTPSYTRGRNDVQVAVCDSYLTSISPPHHCDASLWLQIGNWWDGHQMSVRRWWHVVGCWHETGEMPIEGQSVMPSSDRLLTSFVYRVHVSPIPASHRCLHKDTDDSPMLRQ